jgi:hypothetical protein
MNGMEIDDESEDLGPIMTVMGLWRVEGALQEADTHMQDGDMSEDRPSTLCRKCTASDCWDYHVGRAEIQC